MASQKSGWISAVLALFGRNWITIFGSSLTTASALAIAVFVLLGATGILDFLYVGIVAFLILPGIFVAGLLLIPVGVWWEHKREKRAAREPVGEMGPYPTIDFNKPHVRRIAAVVSILTFVNLLIISTVSYSGVHYMESPEFCGKVCHTVMEPEYTSYINSPHARVACVECHIGPGAPWFVRSKLSGVGQVLAVTFGTYEHPIPTPVANLRPSQDTCEQCHWPERFTGDRIKVISKFAEDEANTETTTVLSLHIGGGKTSSSGIHSWHIDPDKETTYYTSDPTRMTIDVVHVKNADGTITEYEAPLEEGQAPRDLSKMEKRRMDCIDCHSRPTHIFQLPDEALNAAMADGRISKTLPFIKKIGMEALTAATGNEGDLEAIARTVRSYYQENHGDAYASLEQDIDAAIEAMQAIYRRNVFPQMDVTWGTYRSHIGHETVEVNGQEKVMGCFRCHDEQHTSKDGKVISQDCSICHTALALDEENPPVLEQLGIR